MSNIYCYLLASICLTYTRWFKYDRDWFVCKQAAQVPVIFEPPCTCCCMYSLEFLMMDGKTETCRVLIQRNNLRNRCILLVYYRIILRCTDLWTLNQHTHFLHWLESCKWITIEAAARALWQLSYELHHHKICVLFVARAAICRLHRQSRPTVGSVC
jgi:hypothetical protein